MTDTSTHGTENEGGSPNETEDYERLLNEWKDELGPQTAPPNTETASTDDSHLADRVTFSADTAKAFLAEFSFKTQRNISKATVAKYAEQMTAGVPDHQTEAVPHRPARHSVREIPGSR